MSTELRETRNVGGSDTTSSFLRHEVAARDKEVDFSTARLAAADKTVNAAIDATRTNESLGNSNPEGTDSTRRQELEALQATRSLSASVARIDYEKTMVDGYRAVGDYKELSNRSLSVGAVESAVNRIKYDVDNTRSQLEWVGLAPTGVGRDASAFDWLKAVEKKITDGDYTPAQLDRVKTAMENIHTRLKEGSLYGAFFSETSDKTGAEYDAYVREWQAKEGMDVQRRLAATQRAGNNVLADLAGLRGLAEEVKNA